MNETHVNLIIDRLHRLHADLESARDEVRSLTRETLNAHQCRETGRAAGRVGDSVGSLATGIAVLEGLVKPVEEEGAVVLLPFRIDGQLRVRG